MLQIFTALIHFQFIKFIANGIILFQLLCNMFWHHNVQKKWIVINMLRSQGVNENIICDRICENRPPCKICTLEIRAFERGHVVLDPNFFYYATVILGPLATSRWSLTAISASVRALYRETCSLFERPVIV